jgi:hypothetical protein
MPHITFPPFDISLFWDTFMAVCIDQKTTKRNAPARHASKTVDLPEFLTNLAHRIVKKKLRKNVPPQ